MTRQHASRAAATTTARRVAGASAVAICWAITSPATGAGAAPDPREARHLRGDHHGNGHHNRNTISTRSPTHNHGYQHTNSSNAGGLNSVQNALCRRSTVCNVTQKITIIRPEPVRPYVPPKAEPVSPEPGEEVRPANLDTGQTEEVRFPDSSPPASSPPIARPAMTAPAIAAPTMATPAMAATADPYLYLSPFGISMMTPMSRMPFSFGTAQSAPSFTFPLNMLR